jgi:surface antigen
MYLGVNWGNANSWDEAAKQTGVKIDKTPKPGCIAQTDAGSEGYGHVAWVVKVEGGKVFVEEYNWSTSKVYDTRWVDQGDFNYIHLTANT